MFYIIVIGIIVFIILILYVLSRIKYKKEEIEIQAEEYERLSQQEKIKEEQTKEYINQIMFYNLINDVLSLKKLNYKLSCIKKRRILSSEELQPNYKRENLFNTYVLISENTICLRKPSNDTKYKIIHELLDKHKDNTISKETISKLSDQIAEKITHQFEKIEIVIMALNYEMRYEIEKQIKRTTGFDYRQFPYIYAYISLSDDKIDIHLSEFHCDQMAQSPGEPDYRGKGYGSLLLHSALDYFSDFIKRLKWIEKPSTITISGTLAQADKKHYKSRNKFYYTHGFRLIPNDKTIMIDDIENIIEGSFTASLQDLMTKKKENEKKYTTQL